MAGFSSASARKMDFFGITLDSIRSLRTRNKEAVNEMDLKIVFHGTIICFDQSFG